MSTSTVQTQTKNAVNFRYGQDFTHENRKFSWRRQPYANKLVIGVVDDALGKGFNIIDTKTKKPIPKNDEALKVINTMWVDIKKTMYYDRAYGKGLGILWDTRRRGVSVPVFRSYDPRWYYPTYDQFAVMTKCTVVNKVGGMEAQTKSLDLLEEDLEAAYEIVVREDDVKGEGLSALEPVWDTLFGLATLDEQGTYYAIRYGSGIRYMKIPQKKFNDPAFMANIFSMLRGAIGSNGVYALPYATINGVNEEFSIESETATQIDFTSLKKMLLGSLSAQTGIPIEVFEGSLLGLRSSEKNEDRYFDFLQSLQDDYKPFILWLVALLNNTFNWYSEDIIIDIDYIPRNTLSSDEKLEEADMKVDIVTKAGYNVSKEWLAGVVDIPIEQLEEKEIDPLGISDDGSDEQTDNTDENIDDDTDDSSDNDED